MKNVYVVRSAMRDCFVDYIGEDGVSYCTENCEFWCDHAPKGPLIVTSSLKLPSIAIGGQSLYGDAPVEKGSSRAVLILRLIII
ncbi:hypothetical protein OUZ56_006532 [Daphnia magna]|uniref:Uncharacterized protein n=1 Tax=Daphnia magna TaxID=35525 RepID=A0ABQ9YVX5_9CRUS|nr:hypothetical protein OUZ56_006532 [Daphnia magna]